MHSQDDGSCNIVLLRCKWLLLSLCIKGLLLTTVVAQTSPSDQTGAAVTDTVQTAPVMIDGELLFLLRGFPAYPAEKRAEAVTQTILDLAKDPTYIPGTLQIVSREGYLAIMAETRVVVVATDLDAGPRAVGASASFPIFCKTDR